MHDNQSHPSKKLPVNLLKNSPTFRYVHGWPTLVLLKAEEGHPLLIFLSSFRVSDRPSQSHRS
jgi:hypothetical protein